MLRRIVGIETEYGISCTHNGHKIMGPEDISRLFFRPVIEKYSSSNVFLGNGSRLYLDVGSHPEVATAECDHIHDLLAQDRAGDLRLAQLVDQAEQNLAEQNITARVNIFKNNVDSSGNSFGCHENYLLDRMTQVRSLTTGFLPFLVTRQIVCGAGVIHTDEQGSQFGFSQRADHMWDGISSATTRSRPIINTRDEPHADSAHYRRLHVIAGDTTMCEPTTELKIASAMLVLNMLESGVDAMNVEIQHPVRTMKETSRDLSGSALVELTDGSTATAWEIQTRFFEAACQFAQDNPLENDPELTQRILDLWQRTLNSIESGNYSSISSEIDWAMKHQLVDQYCYKHNIGLDDPKVANLLLSYHDIHPARGIHRLLEQRGKIQRRITDEAAEHALHTPPATTRAHIRGQFIDKAVETETEFAADWMHLKLPAHPELTVSLPDPLDNSNTAADELINSLA